MKVLFAALLCFVYTLIATGQDSLSNYGVWLQDDHALPAFELNFHRAPCPWYPFSHTMSTGSNMVLTNQWGDVHVLNTESGLNNLTPALWYTRGGFYPMIEIDGELTSLLYTELDSARTVTYGIGYTTFAGISTRSGYALRIVYTIVAPFNFEKGFHASLAVENLSDRSVEATLTANSDVWIRPPSNNAKAFSAALDEKEKLHGRGSAGFVAPAAGFESIWLIGSPAYTGSNTHQRMVLSRALTLAPGDRTDDLFQFGYNTDYAVAQDALSSTSERDLRRTWLEEVKKADSATDEAWMNRETVWDYSQLLSFTFYDKSLDERLVSLGGYGIGELNAPNSTFSMREAAETAMVLAYFNPELAKSSLRWMAKTQTVGGDLLRLHNHRPLKLLPAEQRYHDDFPNESDTEIWFLMAVGEYVRTTGDTAFLSERVGFMNEGQSGTVWEHATAALDFIKNKIGTGEQGLICMLHGDWNDYFSKIGEEGNGQSVMNTGMLCRALLTCSQAAE